MWWRLELAQLGKSGPEQRPQCCTMAACKTSLVNQRVGGTADRQTDRHARQQGPTLLTSHSVLVAPWHSRTYTAARGAMEVCRCCALELCRLHLCTSRPGNHFPPQLACLIASCRTPCGARSSSVGSRRRPLPACSWSIGCGTRPGCTASACPGLGSRRRGC